MDFFEKIVLITGASKGLGKYISEFFEKNNANVIGIYNETKINNSKIDSVKCDLSSEEDINKLFRYIKEKYGKVDILINCAALCLDNDLYDKTKKEFMKVLEVNLVGTFLMCKMASQLMKDGVIINVSSSDATDTFSTFSMDYAASKAGLENLTKSLALRLPKIKICAIAPNWIDTETILSMNQDYLMREMKRVNQKRLLTKEEVTNKIVEIIFNNNIKSGCIVRINDCDE